MTDAKRNSKTPPAQFLDLKSYRQKRLKDAATLLPLVGGLVFLYPLIYLFVPIGEPSSPGTTTIYLFSFWLILIVCAAYLAPRMQTNHKQD
ncbi:MAG: hypothetical protein ACJAXU_000686 [Paracoccaceae bacterium]|jgi:hypothetical protein